ncbi:DUF4388 domain-containing protein, partial [Nitrospirota bacterium]
MNEIPDKGYLRNYSLPCMLITLNRKRASGVLSISSQGDVKKIFLEKGNAVFATSTYSDDRLGEMLFKLGKINVKQYDEAVSRMKKTDKKLGAVFIELGILSPKELFWAVNRQVQEIIYSLLVLKDGLYEYSPDVEIPKEIIPLDLSMANLILEGVRRITDWTRIKNELPDMENILMLTDDPRSLFQDISLNEDERSVLALVDGDRTIQETIDASELGSFDATKIIYVLWSVSMVTEQFSLQVSGLTIDDILSPVDDRREEFLARVNSIHDVLDSLKPIQLLAVDERADFEEITKQYYRMTKEFHPDRYPDIKDLGIKDKISNIFDA